MHFSVAASKRGYGDEEGVTWRLGNRDVGTGQHGATLGQVAGDALFAWLFRKHLAIT